MITCSHDGEGAGRSEPHVNDHEQCSGESRGRVVTGMSGWSKISRMFWQSDFVHVAFGPTRSNAHAPSRPKASCRREGGGVEAAVDVGDGSGGNGSGSLSPGEPS